MPRGKFVNHKGRNRHFTNPEELEEQRRADEEKRRWRQQKGGDSSSEEEEEPPKKPSKAKQPSESESESESESSGSENEGKAKGVEALIEVENPNRVQKKTKKLSQLNNDLAQQSSKPELSRREREQLEKQRAYANYQKLHAAGKTDEARADLARLAIIKQQREEAAKRREDEKKQKEQAAQKKTEATQKALGKRT
ncbi:28 kDa heat- and acid-stable phosphoprotein [Fopius arisanus]|uniref:28 kDa heat- and acid-stable phosphoprotein n=1 Tax=Fopius arisanus TaxID=64838 RepID=A0A0C9QI14_9HYME|nr:PREDICTED: 28 kDa heat- and acid-stable phosphoprotein [Fopius arisanus]